MKYIEYVWLAGAVFMCVMMASEFEHLQWWNMIILITGIAIFAFMFSFRRRQRQLFEKRWEEEMMEEEEQEAAEQVESEEETA